MNKKNRKGFTIVELVIVIAVIGILATVLVPTFGDIITKANDSKSLQEARNIYTNYVARHADETGNGQNVMIKVNGKYFQVTNGVIAAASAPASDTGVVTRADGKCDDNCTH